MKFKLAEICTSVTQTPAVELYTHIRTGLQREIQLVDQMPQYSYMNLNGGSGSGMLGVSPIIPGMHTPNIGNIGNPYPCNVLCNQINGLDSKMNEVFGEIQQFRTNYDSFHSCFSSYNQSKAHMTPQEIQNTDVELQTQCRMLAAARSHILQNLNSIIARYSSIQEHVIQELKNWQRNQALAGNGAPFRDNLDEIQQCIELLVKTVDNILENANMMNMIRLDNNDDISEMINRIRSAKQLLVLSSFIVEKQPPQVMKTNTRLVCFLNLITNEILSAALNKY